MLTYLCGLWLPLLATLGFPFMVWDRRKWFQVAHLDVLENWSIILINIQGLISWTFLSSCEGRNNPFNLWPWNQENKNYIWSLPLCKICSLCTLSNIHRNTENYIINFCVLITFPLHLIICHFIRFVSAPLTKTEDSSWKKLSYFLFFNIFLSF